MSRFAALALLLCLTGALAGCASPPLRCDGVLEPINTAATSGRTSAPAGAGPHATGQAAAAGTPEAQP